MLPVAHILTDIVQQSTFDFSKTNSKNWLYCPYKTSVEFDSIVLRNCIIGKQDTFFTFY